MLDDQRVLVATALHRTPRVAPDQRDTVRRGRGLSAECAESPQGREVGRAILDGDAQHEPHAVEPRVQAGSL